MLQNCCPQEIAMYRTINTNEEPIILQEDRVILRNKRDGDRRVHLVLTNKSLIIEFVSGLFETVKNTQRIPLNTILESYGKPQVYIHSTNGLQFFLVVETTDAEFEFYLPYAAKSDVKQLVDKISDIAADAIAGVDFSIDIDDDFQNLGSDDGDNSD